MNEKVKENNSMFECCICNNYKKGEFIVIDDKKYHLNCITNLQQKYDKSLEDNVKESGLRMELQQENERLKKQIPTPDNYIPIEKQMRITSANILQDTEITKIIKERDDYKSRNEKAIEYIKEKQKIQYKFALSHIECDEILRILQGSDKKWEIK